MDESNPGPGSTKKLVLVAFLWTCSPRRTGFYLLSFSCFWLLDVSPKKHGSSAAQAWLSRQLNSSELHHYLFLGLWFPAIWAILSQIEDPALAYSLVTQCTGCHKGNSMLLLSLRPLNPGSIAEPILLSISMKVNASYIVLSALLLPAECKFLDYKKATSLVNDNI